MLRYTLLVVHILELSLYTWLVHDFGDESLFNWFVEVLGLALLVRLVIIALTFLIARTPRRPLMLALGVLAAEYYATVYLYSIAVMRRAPSMGIPDSVQSGHLPVIFIHGFCCNSGFWHKYVARFKHAWGGHLATVDLEPLYNEIEEYAPVISRRIDELLELSGEQSCLIVGHSMGGLAARYLLRDDSERRRIAGVITLGTPHSGTLLASYAMASNVRQMRRFSTWLEQLANDETRYSLPPFEALVGTHDNIVSPQECAAFDRATNTYMIGISHLAMALNNDVLDWTLARCERLSHLFSQAE